MIINVVMKYKPMRLIKVDCIKAVEDAREGLRGVLRWAYLRDKAPIFPNETFSGGAFL